MHVVEHVGLTPGSKALPDVGFRDLDHLAGGVGLVHGEACLRSSEIIARCLVDREMLTVGDTLDLVGQEGCPECCFRITRCNLPACGFQPRRIESKSLLPGNLGHSHLARVGAATVLNPGSLLHVPLGDNEVAGLLGVLLRVYLAFACTPSGVGRGSDEDVPCESVIRLDGTEVGDDALELGSQTLGGFAHHTVNVLSLNGPAHSVCDHLFHGASVDALRFTLPLKGLLVASTGEVSMVRCEVCAVSTAVHTPCLNEFWDSEIHRVFRKTVLILHLARVEPIQVSEGLPIQDVLNIQLRSGSHANA
ncbi:MAG: hypothetical protein CMJ67_10410 [Planctomycetaceae bacterium]|nr:hypothetical protein [Planctomycetaceae bacterium]